MRATQGSFVIIALVIATVALTAAFYLFKTPHNNILQPPEIVKIPKNLNPFSNISGSTQPPKPIVPEKTDPSTMDFHEMTLAKLNLGRNNVVSYKSDKLGVTIYHIPQNEVKEIGNKLFGDYYDDGGQPVGQYVQVFKKDSKQSLKDAIEEQVLNKTPKGDCEIVETQNADASFEIAELHSDTNSCPRDYTQTDDIRHFYYNYSKSETFLFVDLGHYTPLWFIDSYD